VGAAAADPDARRTHRARAPLVSGGTPRGSPIRPSATTIAEALLVAVQRLYLPADLDPPTGVLRLVDFASL